MKKTLAALLLAAALPAAANDTRIVLDFTSEEGETKDAFVYRVATFMNGWTHYNGVEACGFLLQRGESYAVVVGTSDSQIHCDNTFGKKDYENTGVTIHTHPTPRADGKIKLTDRSRKFLGGAYDGRNFFAIERKQFSKGDYAAGAGYLVTEGVLLYQEGVGTRKVVADLPAVP